MAEKKSMFDSFNMKLLGIVALIVLPIALYMAFVSNQQENIVEAEGSYFVARVVDKKEKSSKFEIHVKLEYEQKTIETVIETNAEDYSNYTIGQSLMVRGKKGHWDATQLCESVKYDPCFGDQPEKGWDEIPSCD